MPFSKLGLCPPIINAIKDLGYTKPTTIQEKAIPLVLNGRNLIAGAQTGTGKTASFVLPLLEMLSKTETQRKKRVRALILAPTRELALQVERSIKLYGKQLQLTSLAMYGGVDAKPQKQALIEGVDILVATPGRLLDMYTQRAVHFEEIEFLVLDEADKMLDMGFIEDINKIIDKLPTERQNLLFSATLSKQVRALAKTAINNPVEISLTADASQAPKIDQWLITVDKDKKSALLSHLIKENNWNQALIFIETKQGAAKLVSQLEKRDIQAECIHSGRSQEIRERILADFKRGEIQFLIATGVASRGIDIDELSRVVNYDLPFPADEYIHRIGRTGRAGATGEAVSLVSKDDFKNLCAIESRLGHLINRKEIDGFTPKKIVPISVLNFVPKNKSNTKPKTAFTKHQSTNANKLSKGEASEQGHTKSEQQKSRKPKSKPQPVNSKKNSSSDKPANKADDLNPWNL